MSVLSLRERWNAVYRSTYGSLANGLRQKQYAAVPRAFPFRSLRSLIASTWWPPARFTELIFPSVLGGGAQILVDDFRAERQRVAHPMRFMRKEPDEVDSGRWTNGVNGVVKDEENWYFIRTVEYRDVNDFFFEPKKSKKKGEITKFSRSLSFADATDSKCFTGQLVIFPPRSKSFVGAVHAGAGTLSRGYIYVPVEETEWDPGDIPGTPGQIWVVDPKDLRVVEVIALERPTDPIVGNPDKAPWCAINEQRGLLYTSSADASGASYIRIYEFSPFNGVERAYPFRPAPLRYLGKLALLLEGATSLVPADEVQDAIVTPNNHLLLLCDTPEGTAVSGMHLFDLMTGERWWHQQWASDQVDSMRDIAGIDISKYDEAQCFVLVEDAPHLWVCFCVKKALEDDDFSVLQYDTWDATDRRRL